MNNKLVCGYWRPLFSFPPRKKQQKKHKKDFWPKLCFFTIDSFVENHNNIAASGTFFIDVFK